MGSVIKLKETALINRATFIVKLNPYCVRLTKTNMKTGQSCPNVARSSSIFVALTLPFLCLKNARWKARANSLQHCVMVIRVVRDFCLRSPIWTNMDFWVSCCLDQSIGAGFFGARARFKLESVVRPMVVYPSALDGVTWPTLDFHRPQHHVKE